MRRGSPLRQRLNKLRTFLRTLAESDDSRTTDRDQLLYAGVLMWGVTGVGIFVAGLVVPALAPPEKPWAYYLGFSCWAILVIISMLTWMRRVGDSAVAWAVN